MNHPEKGPMTSESPLQSPQGGDDAFILAWGRQNAALAIYRWLLLLLMLVTLSLLALVGFLAYRNEQKTVWCFVKDGLGNRSFPAPRQSVDIKQEGCRYVPHMAAVMTGQPVIFQDNDSTLHNIHSMSKNNSEWNQSQMPNSGPLQKYFNTPELLIPIKCNQHPWMKMYLSVLGNPFFAITGKDGKFSLQGLPPGTYTIAAVQEKYGEKTQTVTVGAKEDKSVSFTYQP